MIFKKYWRDYVFSVNMYKCRVRYWGVILSNLKIGMGMGMRILV